MDIESPVMDVSEGEHKGIGEEARVAMELEHQQTFFEAVKLYPGAVGWSIFFSLGVIMTAFDPQLLGNLYATPAFQRDFGYLYNGEYIVSAAWQTGLGMGNPIGQCIGPLLAAYPMEWFGRKWVSLLVEIGNRVELIGVRHFQPVWFSQLASSSCNSLLDRSMSSLLAS